MREVLGSFEAGYRAVLERIAGGAPLPALLDDVVRLIEAQAGEMLCSILLVDREMKCVRHGAAPSLPPDFARALDGAGIGPDAGSCGAAAHFATRVIVEDVATHPYWQRYRDLALQHGLAACWSSPVFAPDGEVLGTFAMYYRVVRGPTASEIEWVDAATHLSAVAILRDRGEQALRRSEARARQLARLHAVSNSVNEAIARERDPERLQELACRIPVEHGLARLAWIGRSDAVGDPIRPVARFGTDDGYIDAIELDLEDDRINRGPAGKVVRSGSAAICDDIASDPDFYWKDEALRRGLRACAVFPLRLGEHTRGIFALYADHPGAFPTEEVEVLSALADDISFALASAATERERSRLETEVRRNEALRAQIYDSVTDVLFYVAIEGPDRYRFLSVNRAFLDATGLGEANVVGKRVDEIIPAASLPLVLEKYAEAIASGRKVSWEEVSEYPAGVKLGEATICPIADGAGRFANLVGTVHDITARRQAEEERHRLETELHQAQRLQSLGTLASGIAHDFNNILTAIRGNAELSLYGLTADHPSRTYLAGIQTASTRATDLVRRILAFGRQQEPRREVLSLPQVVDEALALLRVGLPRQVELTTRFASDAPKAHADSTQVHQVVMNLGANALHAIGRSGGRIEVSVEGHRVDADSIGPSSDLIPGDYALLRVTDTGCGMDEATLKRAFDPFFTTRPPGDGTGLGLSVVHGIMKSHHGAVTVRSQPGRGTTFELFFPAAPAAAEPVAVVTPPPSPGRRILYVDDDDALVFLARRMLERLGHAVTGHSDSIQALADFRARPDSFDVVVTDISMPGLTGPELVTELRGIRPGIPVIMTSGCIRPEDVEAARQVGIKDLIAKPGAMADFARMLAPLLAAPQA